MLVTIPALAALNGTSTALRSPLLRIFEEKCGRFGDFWWSDWTPTYITAAVCSVQSIKNHSQGSSLNEIMKSSRSEYLSSLISSKRRNLKVLFDTINSIVSPTVPALPVSSKADSNDLSYSLWKRSVMSGLTSVYQPFITLPVIRRLLTLCPPLNLWHYMT